MKKLDELLSGMLDTVAIPSVSIAGLTLDSRRLEPGDAFVALAGTRQHGMRHALSALDAGAAVVLHDGLEPRRPRRGRAVSKFPDWRRACPSYASGSGTRPRHRWTWSP